MLNTQDGSVSARAALRKSIYPKARAAAASGSGPARATHTPHDADTSCMAHPQSMRVVRRLDFGTTYSTSQEMSYGTAVKLHVDVTDDGLLSLDVRGAAEVTGRSISSAVARLSGGGVASGARGPSGGRKLGGGGGGGRNGGGGVDVTAAALQFKDAVQLTGRVELTQVILGFNVRAWPLVRGVANTPLTSASASYSQGPQDLKLCLGYDIASKQPYARVKENNWSVRPPHTLLSPQSSYARR